jgi:hypothetical protein
VDALFEASRKAPEPAALDRDVNSSSHAAGEGERPVARTATFNLFEEHQDFLDDFIRSGKRSFRRKPGVGVGAINKSAVLQELLELLEKDKGLQDTVLQNLEKKERSAGSRHDPRRNR